MYQCQSELSVNKRGSSVGSTQQHIPTEQDTRRIRTPFTASTTLKEAACDSDTQFTRRGIPSFVTPSCGELADSKYPGCYLPDYTTSPAVHSPTGRTWSLCGVHPLQASVDKYPGSIDTCILQHTDGLIGPNSRPEQVSPQAPRGDHRLVLTEVILQSNRTTSV
jgi:hypothetical protein